MIRLLYLGRQKTLAQEIETVWQNARAVGSILSSSSLRVLSVTSQNQALDALRGLSLRAILLDVNNQHSPRTRFCQELRRRYPELHIIAVCREPIKPKHFVFDGLLAWPLLAAETEALLRTLSNGEEETRLRIGPIHLDAATRTVQGPRGRHQLPPKQCNLLRILMTHAGEVVSRETIMRQVWETEYLADTRTLDVHICWLREKIEPDPARPVHLLTVRGQGYRLVAR